MGTTDGQMTDGPAPLEGAVVVITGASSGIGAATARAVARRGAHPVLLARRTDRLTSLATEIGHDALAISCDVTDNAQLEKAVRVAMGTFGRIDVLVDNAGRGLHVPVADVAFDDLRAVLDLNVVAAVAAMQAVIPVMRAQHSGTIVMVSSGTTSGDFLPVGIGPYAASKAAVNMLSAVARAELAGDGITVSTIYPFVTATEFHDAMPGHRRPHGVDRMPSADPPERVAEAIVALIGSGDAEMSLVPHRGPRGGRPTRA